MKTLGPIGIQAFERRNISAETAVRYEIYTASRQADGSVIPDGNGNIVVFPFLERGVVVNDKVPSPWQEILAARGARQDEGGVKQPREMIQPLDRLAPPIIPAREASLLAGSIFCASICSRTHLIVNSPMRVGFPPTRGQARQRR